MVRVFDEEHHQLAALHGGSPSSATVAFARRPPRRSRCPRRGLAQTADVPLDFLYRSTEIRRRVEQLRSQQRNHPPQPATQPPDDSPGSVVRTLTAQLAELKRQHRDEVQALRQALEAAQSENLELRRRLGPRHTTQPATS